MLNVKCPEYLAKVKEFATKVGLLEQLEGQLQYLATYGSDEDPNYCRCDLFKDFAPHSFTFCLYRTQKGEVPVFWLNGGLIYQGPDSPADGSFPSLTVSLAHGTGWFIHT